MMKKLLVMCVTLSMLLGCFTAYGKSSDLVVKDGYDAVNAFSESDILIGDGDGDLRLEDTITRAEFCKLFCETGLMENFTFCFSEHSFSDVPKDHWAHDYIAQMSIYGLLKGVEKNLFAPEDPIRLIDGLRIALRFITSFRSDLDVDVAASGIEHNITDHTTSLFLDNMTRKDATHILYNTACEYEYLSRSGEDLYTYVALMESQFQTAISVGSAQLDGMIEVEDSSTYGGGVTPPSSSTSEAEEDFSYYGAFDSLDGGSSGYAYGYSASQESYTTQEENGFKDALFSPLSTFSIDTDTASYSNTRRMLLDGMLPQPGTVRTEELINYFTYENEKPQQGDVFAVTCDVATSPWNEENLLARISIQGEELPKEERKPQNLVFLLDVSGSMDSRDKLPLVQRSAELLLDNLDERDTVSIVTYAGRTRVVLDGAKGNEKEKIMAALYRLSAGGGTAGGAGLNLAYEAAEANRVDGNNRIILCTDGDFNVGIRSNEELKSLVEEKRKSGIYLSILGFGTGNLKDDKLEIMANNGNGGYYYIDSLKEAEKVLVHDMTKTLYTIAEDVKIQVEFNPAFVSEYRLIGYENRMLETEDFADDTKDAGELGAGSTVTALYEIVPASDTAQGSDLRYSKTELVDSDDLMCVSIRYKNPGETESILRKYPVQTDFPSNASGDLAFAAAVAELGMLLNNSEYKGNASYDTVLNLALSARGEDPYDYRGEFIRMVDLLRLMHK